MTKSSIVMDCAVVRDGLLAGSLEQSPELEAHLSTCRGCALLVAGGAELGRALAGAAAAAGTPMAAEGARPESLAELERRAVCAIRAERGPLAWLRSRPTPLRITLAVALAAGLVGACALFAGREDLGRLDALELGVVLGGAGVTLVAASLRLLRPLHAPPAAGWTGAALCAMGLAVPTVLALITSRAGAPEDGQPVAAMLGAASPCLALGLLGAAPLLALTVALRRTRADGGTVAALGGVAAGLTGYLCLHVHCGATDRAHLLLGHVAVVALAMGLGLLPDAVTRRRARG
ncbi:MAG: hypothetical protein HY908_02920 [Myxococcales bacterium]|nr:hypothetical protein [Myxococcales bacterium]